MSEASEASKDTIDFLEGNPRPYYATKKYITMKDKIRKEKWGSDSYEEIINFFHNSGGDKDGYFLGFLRNGNKRKEFWPNYAFNSAPKYMYKVLKYWKENPPIKEIINDFMRQVNYNNKRLDCIFFSLFSNIGKKELDPYNFENLEDAQYFYDWQVNNTLTIEEGLDTLKILIYFNIKLDREYLFKILLDIIDPCNIKFVVKAKILINKTIAGRKIAKFITNQMDDEFVLSPLRKKIEMRRFEDLIKTNKKADNSIYP